MEILRFSINAMAPVMISAALGWFLRWRNLIDEGFTASLNKMCFRVFLPIMLFNNIYRIDFRSQFVGKLIAYAVGIQLLVLVLLLLILPRFIKDRGRLATTLNATFRSNYIIYAVPLITRLFGEEGMRVATMLSPVAICLFNFVGVVTMCYYSGDDSQPKSVLIRTTAADVLRNPLIVSSVLGALFALSGIPSPAFFSDALSSLGALGSPMGLILLGAQLDWETMRGNISSVLGSCAIRLLFVPILGILPAIALGFRGPELGTLLMLFGTPCPVTASVLARNYNMAPRYAAQLVAMSTVLSAFTIFLWISLLRGLKLF